MEWNCVFGMTVNKIYIHVNEKKMKTWYVYTTSYTTIAPMFLLTSIIKQDNANKM